MASVETGFTRVVSLLGRGKLVDLKGTWYGLINGRVSWVVLNEERTGYSASQCQVRLDHFEMVCESFAPGIEGTVINCPIIETPLETSDEEVYDFTKFQGHNCVKCSEWVSPENVIKQGKFGHCPSCFNQFYKAPRIDGTYDDDHWLNQVSDRTAWGGKKKEKAPEITDEQKVQDRLDKQGGKTFNTPLSFSLPIVS